MATPPKVRSVNQILAELDPAFNPQRKVVQQQQAALPGLFEGQRQGLESRQRKEFKNIELGANRRGLLFSGIPLAEQAEFTSDVFLPSLTDLEQQRNERGFALQGALADLASQQRQLALATREQEKQRLFEFQEAERQRAAARRAAAAAQASQFNAAAELKKLLDAQNAKNEQALKDAAADEERIEKQRSSLPSRFAADQARQQRERRAAAQRSSSARRPSSRGIFDIFGGFF